MVDFLFYDLFPMILGFFDKVFSVITLSIRSLITGNFDIPLPDWEWLDFSLLALMIGVGFSFFVIFTIVKWILNLIT